MTSNLAANDIVPAAARLKARKIGEVDGSAIFAIPEGWPSALLRRERDVVTTETPTAFEAAVQANDNAAIFVPRDTFGWKMMERILKRNSLNKTIFWEE